LATIGNCKDAPKRFSYDSVNTNMGKATFLSEKGMLVKLNHISHILFK